MDVKYINPFVDSFLDVMPQLGFTDVSRVNLSLRSQDFIYSGVIVLVGIVGELRGNVVFRMDTEEAERIASAMLMDTETRELDEMAKSALSELANMIAANAATNFANTGILIDISTPRLIYGENVLVKMSAKQVLCINFLCDKIPMELHIGIAPK